VAAFGIFQYFAGPGWLTSLSPGFARAVFYASGAGTGRTGGVYFRTISTFVQTGGFAIYLCFMMLVAVAQFNMASLRKARWWIIAAFGLQFLALLTTGGRTPLVLFFVGIALLMTMQGRMARVLPIVAILAVLFIGSVIVLGPVVAERFATLLDLEVVQARNLPLVYGWLYEAMNSDPAGMGAGYATVASRHAGVTPLNYSVVENTFARIRFETGLPGLAIYVIFILALVRECIRVTQKTPDRELSWLASACAAFLLVNIFLNLPWGTPFDTPPTNVYLWFFLGFMARAPQLAPAVEPRVALSQMPAAGPLRVTSGEVARTP
jgi:cell division protein FtsW (lipid II flippase)